MGSKAEDCPQFTMTLLSQEHFCRSVTGAVFVHGHRMFPLRGFLILRRSSVAKTPRFQGAPRTASYPALFPGKNATADLHSDSRNGFNQRSGFDERRQQFPLILPFHTGIFRRHSLISVWTLWRSFLAQQRASSAQVREARVSH